MAAADGLPADEPGAEREKPVSPNATWANGAVALGFLSVPAQGLVVLGGWLTLVPVVLVAAAIILGIIAFALARLRPKSFKGYTRAAAGIALGVASSHLRPDPVSFNYLRIGPVCAANLRGIGMALSEYCDHYSTYPPSLQQLVETGLSTDGELKCPFAWFRERGETDYVYVTGLSPADPADWIIAYDHPANHPRRAFNVLYVSGEVKHLYMDDFVGEFKRFRDAYIAARGELPKTIGPSWP
ncbi:MAG TPA: hypothetical protein VM487_15375 [Phycisphaerae bacterium]|nr:hypothetical protein [Phycisphaerae bacterium]